SHISTNARQVGVRSITSDASGRIGMTQGTTENLLARLAGKAGPGDDNLWASIGATPPKQVETSEKSRPEEKEDKRLDELLNRIKNMPGAAEREPPQQDAFLPLEPDSLQAAQLTEGEVEALVLKYLLACGNATGREIADQVKLPFKLVEEILRQLKHDQLLVYRGSATMNDYQYQLTDVGRERARRHSTHCTYFGSAP